LQEGKPVAYSSGSLTETQKRYAQIEKEMLAIVIGCKKFYQFIWGKQCVIETDHKPLEAIFSKPISDVSPRLLRMRMKLQNLNLVIKYVPGNKIPIADHLSRSFLKDSVLCQKLEKTLETQILQVKSDLPMPKESWEKYVEATIEDEELCKLKEIINRGWPERKDQLNDVRLTSYWNVRDHLHHNNGLIFKNRQMVVPHKYRSIL
jgi:hypothetical protein